MIRGEYRRRSRFSRARLSLAVRVQLLQRYDLLAQLLPVKPLTEFGLVGNFASQRKLVAACRNISSSAPAEIQTATAAEWAAWRSNICKGEKLIASGSTSARWTCRCATRTNVISTQTPKN